MKADRSRGALAASALMLLPLLVYLPLRSAGFVWDDDSYVTQNENLRSAAGLLRIWFEPRSIPQYYPLVHTSYWAEYRLWGLSAAGFHATNVLLHGVSAVLLWRVLARLRVPGAWLAAAIFAVHPVMTESVAWITERKNVLSLALALGAFATYLHFAPPEPDRRGRAPWRSYAFALLLYTGALLSKTVVCSLPAVILVVLWWKRGRIRVADVVPLIPFFALGLAAAASTIWLEKNHVGASGEEWALAPIERVLLAGRALWFYAGKLVWPHPLIFFYPRWQVSAAQPWQWLFPIGVLLVAAPLWVLRTRIGRGPLAALVIFAGVLFPALGFFDVYPFRYSYVADHFQYHAAPALIALFAAACVGVVARLGPRARVPSQLAAGVLLVVLGTLGFRQAHVYHDLDTLYRRTIADNPLAWNAYLNLANLLSAEGRDAEAVPLAREAARLAPQIADAHNTLGGVLLMSAPAAGAAGPAQVAEAIAAFERTLVLDPGHVDALYNGAVALSTAGRHEEASRNYAQLLAAQPGDVDAMVGLGISLGMQGRVDEAEPHLREALRRAPGRADAQQAIAAIAAQRRERAGIQGTIGP
jgi:tetratricopeptide (TPR) repeat protein